MGINVEWLRALMFHFVPTAREAQETRRVLDDPRVRAFLRLDRSQRNRIAMMATFLALSEEQRGLVMSISAHCDRLPDFAVGDKVMEVVSLRGTFWNSNRWPALTFTAQYTGIIGEDAYRDPQHVVVTYFAGRFREGEVQKPFLPPADKVMNRVLKELP